MHIVARMVKVHGKYRWQKVRALGNAHDPTSLDVMFGSRCTSTINRLAHTGIGAKCLDAVAE
jgi:hypothetical protein